MKTRLALFTTVVAIVLTAFAAPASPANHPQKFHARLTVTVISCQGGNLPECEFQGSSHVPRIGSVDINGSIIKGCVIPLDFCIWNLGMTLTPNGPQGGQTLGLSGSIQWPPDQPAPTELPWTSTFGFTAQGTFTDDFSYALPLGSQFTINVEGTLE